MEFLDYILTKDSSFSLYTINRPFFWRILKKIILYSGFNNPYKKSAKQENSSLSEKWQKLESEKTQVFAQKPRLKWHSRIPCQKMRVENQTKTQVWEYSSLCTETSTNNACSRIPSQDQHKVLAGLLQLKVLNFKVYL